MGDLDGACVQAEEAGRAGDFATADTEYLWAIDMCKTRQVLTPGVMLDLCRLRLRAGEGAPAVEACGLAVEWDRESEDAIVHKVNCFGTWTLCRNEPAAQMLHMVTER